LLFIRRVFSYSAKAGYLALINGKGDAGVHCMVNYGICVFVQTVSSCKRLRS